MNEATDTVEPKRHRGPGSLPFLRVDAKPIWRHYPRLAEIAEKAKLTERESEVMLRWRALDQTPAEIAEAMGMKRQHFWRYRRHINSKLDLEFPDLEYEVAIVRAIAQDEQRDLIHCQKNSQGGSRTPIYYQSGNGIWRAWTSPTMTLPCDLRRPYVQSIDLV